MMVRMKTVRSTLSGGFTVLRVSGVSLVVLLLMALVILGALVDSLGSLTTGSRLRHSRRSRCHSVYTGDRPPLVRTA